MQHMPELVTQWGQGGANYQLWPAQILAVHNLEDSLAANKPKALIQMATGSGKTFTAISFIYRLIKFGGARRVLFLLCQFRQMLLMLPEPSNSCLRYLG
jgi:type I restriction enzyme R subunit